MYTPEYISGESVYSWVAQCAQQSPYDSWKQTNLRLFDKEYVRLHPTLPGHINKIAKASGTCPEQLLRQGTAYSLFALSLGDPAKALALKTAMLGQDSGGIAAISRQTSCKMSLGNRLKFCPSCLVDDEKAYGVTYWHTCHQLQGVAFCVKHKELLLQIGAGEGGINHQYLLPTLSLDGTSSASSSPQLYLSEFITELHAFLNRSQHPSALNELYLDWLDCRNYVTAKGHLRSKQLKHDLRQNWSKLFNVYPEVLPGELFDFHYVPNLVHRRTSTHYIKHVLLMAFLTNTPENFFKGVTRKPAKKPSKKQEVKVDDCSLLSLLKQQVPMRQIAAKSGYSMGYIKQFALRHKLPINRRRQHISASVERSIWRQAFMGHHRKEIAEHHQVSIGSVEHIIQSHRGLSDWRRHLNFVKKQRTARDELTEHLSSAPKATRNEVKQECSRAYMWLYKHDQEWLYEHLPAAQATKYSPCVVWEKRDSFIATQIQHMDVRVNSLSEMDRKIGGHLWLTAHREQMPLSVSAAQKKIKRL